MKKILFLIPNLGGGGAERVLVTLLNNLDKTKYDITLLSLFDYGNNKELLNSDIKYDFFFKKQFRGNSHFFKLFSPQTLYKKIIKKDYDIVISYLEGPTTRIVSGCQNPTTKLINWVHVEVDNEKQFLNPYRNKTEFKNVYEKFDYTVFVSKTAEKSFRNIYNTLKINSLVKYNTVDAEKIRELSRVPLTNVLFEDSVINLVSVGRFTQQKGYDRLLEITKKLKEEGLNFRLYLIGKGELENQFLAYIKDNNLESHVKILGFKKNPYNYIKNCDLFICSSYREGYSTAVTESLIIGTPVITTNCSGMTEILGEKNQYGIIADNNLEDLYDEIKNVLLNSSTLTDLKRKAIERSSLFSIKKTVTEIERIFDHNEKVEI